MNVKIGDTVLVEIPKDTGKEVFTSHIVKVRGNEIALTTLFQNQRPVELNYRVPLRFTIVKQDALYEFTTSISYRGYSHFFVPVPENVIRKQRRYEVRVPVKFPVEVFFSYRSGIPVAAYLTNSLDLSAGGIKIATPVRYPPHTLLRLTINVAENDQSYISALAIRSGPIERPEFGNPFPDWTALKFQQITEQQRKKIRKFIYRWQELRVKSLI